MSRSSRNKLPTEPVRVKIESLSHDVRGVTHIDGKAVFIDDTLPDEEVEFIYTRRKRSYDEGKLHKIITPSPDRIEPHCQHFGVCGGCSLQHLDSEKQIHLKQTILLDNLNHLGHVKPETVLPPVTGPAWGYRRKARLGVKYVFKKEKLMVGFREKRNSYIADIQSCPVLHPSVGTKLTLLADLLGQFKIRDKIPQIEVAVSDTQSALVVRHLEDMNDENKEMLKAFAKEQEFLIFLQPGGLNTVALLDNTQEMINLHYTIPEFDIEMTFQPTQFTQVNSEINKKMIKLAYEFLAPDKNDHILDLFCGMGNFTLPIARSGATVTGLEGNKELIQLATNNAKNNKLDNVEFKTVDLFDETKNAQWMEITCNKILLDPPRSGALNVVENINKKKIEKIVYISCNPSTLARDADILVNKKGFKLTHAGVMDMFPHTSHVEAIAVFEKS